MGSVNPKKTAKEVGAAHRRFLSEIAQRRNLRRVGGGGTGGRVALTLRSGEVREGRRGQRQVARVDPAGRVRPSVARGRARGQERLERPEAGLQGQEEDLAVLPAAELAMQAALPRPARGAGLDPDLVEAGELRRERGGGPRARAALPRGGPGGLEAVLHEDREAQGPGIAASVGRLPEAGLRGWRIQIGSCSGLPRNGHGLRLATEAQLRRPAHVAEQRAVPPEALGDQRGRHLRAEGPDCDNRKDLARPNDPWETTRRIPGTNKDPQKPARENME